MTSEMFCACACLRSSKMAAKIFLCLLRGFQWIPVLFINAVIVWSYYAYVFVLCYQNVKSDAEKVAYLLMYHPFFLLLMVSYWRTIMTNSDGVPREFVLTIAERRQMDNEDNPQEVLDEKCNKLPVYTKTLSGGVRFCDICQAVKPDRCHHCTMCRSCILKMDHHCPWVNNCVGFKNYKFFTLFLFYAILYTTFITATVIKYFIAFWNNELEGDGKLHILFLFFVAVMFSISLWSLFGYHVWLTSNNRSTLESFRVPHFRHGADKDGFSLGSASKNAEQVLGKNRLLWFLPIYTSLGDGVRYPMHNQPAEEDSLLNERQQWMEEGDVDENGLPEEQKQESSTEISIISQAELTQEYETQDTPTVTVSQTLPAEVVTVDVSPTMDGTTL